MPNQEKETTKLQQMRSNENKETKLPEFGFQANMSLGILSLSHDKIINHRKEEQEIKNQKEKSLRTRYGIQTEQLESQYYELEKFQQSEVVQQQYNINEYSVEFGKMGKNNLISFENEDGIFQKRNKTNLEKEDLRTYEIMPEINHGNNNNSNNMKQNKEEQMMKQHNYQIHEKEYYQSD